MGRDTPLLRGIYGTFVRAKVETGAEEAAMRNRRKRNVRNDRWKEKSALYLLVFLFIELQIPSKLSVSNSRVVSRIIFRRIDASFLFLRIFLFDEFERVLLSRPRSRQ